MLMGDVSDDLACDRVGAIDTKLGLERFDERNEYIRFDLTLFK